MSDRGTKGHPSVASSFQLEAMEPRLLLTTIYGGEIFRYLDPNDQVVEIQTTGSLILELIGAAVSGSDMVLTDLPGTIVSSTMGRSGGQQYETLNSPYDDTLLSGGLGGAQGVVPITVANYATWQEAEIKGAPLVVGAWEAPATEISIEALAINDAGEIWALNRVEVNQTTAIQLLQINRTPSGGFLTATVRGELYNQLKTAAGGGDDFAIDAVRAADFNPINGLLYFVMSQGPDQQDLLVSLDVHAAVPSTTITASSPTGNIFQDTRQNNARVDGIAFDQTGANTAVMIVYQTYVDGAQQKARLAQIVVNNNAASAVTGSFQNSRELVDVEGRPIMTLTGIEIAGDDPTRLERYVYGADSNAADSQVIKADREYAAVSNQALGRAIGPLGDPLDPDAVQPANLRLPDSRLDNRVRGQNLGDLAWDPTSVNPFTGELGAMVGIDLETDELVYVDLRERPRNASFFAIYVVKGDPNGTIMIGPVDENGIMDVTNGDSGRILVGPESVNAPSESGLVYLGVKVLDPVTNTYILPKITGALGELGVRPAGEGEAVSGLEVVKSLMKYVGSGADWQSLLLGQNVDRVRGLAVNRAGQAYVIDIDRQNATSTYISGDELYAIDVTTGQAAANGYTVLSASDHSFLYAVKGMDYGDPNRTGVESLYAIYGTQLGTLNPLPHFALGQGYAVQDYYNPLQAVVGTASEGSPLTLTLQSGTITITVAGAGTVTARDNTLATNNVLDTLVLSGTNALTRVSITRTSNAIQVGRVLGDDVTGIQFDDGALDMQIAGIAEFTAVATLAGVGRVDAMAFGPGQELYVVGGSGQATKLYRVNTTTGAATDLGALTDTLRNAPLIVNAMDFVYDGDGVAYLLAHDAYNGRLVDINIATGAVGQVIGTEVGSLNPLVGAMSFDFTNRRLLAVDNSTGLTTNYAERAAANPNDLSEPFSVESAALMEVDLTGAKPQDLKRFILGGTLTGKVDVSGSVDLFYAGWLITGGLGTVDSQGHTISLPDNFHVGVDLHNLMSVSTIGAASASPVNNFPTPQYPGLSGFELMVDGRVGMIRSHVDIMGQYFVANSDALTDFSSLNDIYYEVEEATNPYKTIRGVQRAIPTFSNQIDYRNDDQSGAQFLGAIRSGPAGVNSLRVQGELWGVQNWGTRQRDTVDYYAVSLLAGQTIGVQLIGTGNWPESLRVGVIDPDGRVVASNYSNRDQDNVREKEFRFTADRPGVYYFAVALTGDVNFDGERDDADSGASPWQNGYVSRTYELRVSGVENLALGAIAAGEHVVAQGDAVEVARGDLGAIIAGLSEDTTGLVYDGGWIWADAGSVRAVVATSIGVNPTRNPNLGTGIYVWASGDVGLLKTTDPDGTMLVNQRILIDQNWISVVPPIGGDYQLIDAAGIFNGDIIADGNIGVIRARSLDTTLGAARVFPYRSSFIAGVGGVIDLIDIVEDFGNLSMGGPHIEVGTGGNVRFIRVGGTLYTETVPEPGPGDFAGSVLAWNRVAAGQKMKLTDSTGATFYVSGAQEILNPAYNAFTDDPSEKFLKNDIEVWTYRIHGTSGVALIRLTTSHGGVVIQGDGNYEIGSIYIATQDATELRPGAASTITITGNGKVDVFEIRDLDPEEVTETSVPIGSIDNRTRGSIANIDTLLSVGLLRSGGNIGVIESTTGAMLNKMLPIRMPAEPQTTPQMYFPFDDQRMGVVARSFGDIWAGGAIGNVIALGDAQARGDIQSITADGDNNFSLSDGVFEGIAGPIFATGTIGTWHWELDDRNRPTWVQGAVKIGEGIAPSGSGYRASQAGLYALQEIGPIVGRRGANIYGDIAAGHNVDIDRTLPGVIASIRLDGGSIINADIMRVQTLAMTAEWYTQVITRGEAAEPDAIKNPVFDIGPITLTGGGGIIGSVFHAADIGNVRVEGFGIINSSFTADHGVIGNITAAGYGIRLTDFRANFMRNLTAVGGGELLATSNFSPDVTMSERQAYDRAGLATNRLSDLHAYFGTTDIDHRTVSGYTDAGVIESVQVFVKNLGQVTAWQIRGQSGMYSTNLTADNSLGGVRTVGENAIIDGLEIHAGRLGSFLPATHVSNMQMTVAGPIGDVHIYGNFDGNSSITGSGAFGSIKSLIIDGVADGSIYFHGTVGKIELNEIEDLTIRNTGGAKVAVKSLILHGSQIDSLSITGNVGTMQSDGDLGSLGDRLTIDGSVASLIVGSLRPSAGATLGTNLRIQGDLGQLQVYGQIAGDVEIAGALGSLDVTKAPGGPANLVVGNISVRRGFGTGRITNGNMTGNLNVAEGLSSLSIVNGNLAGNVTAGGDIGTIAISNGSQQAGTAITSALGNINSVRVSGGSLLGSLRAPNGRIDTVSVSGTGAGGNLGGGAVIEAESLGSLTVGQNVLAGARIEVEQRIDSVRVTHDFETGATLSAGSATSIAVSRDLAGAMTLGYSATPTTLKVGRNLGADGVTIAIDANTQAVIGGDIVEGATLSVTRDLTSLQAGVVYGNVLVDGMAGALRVQKLSSALLAVGFDLTSLSVAQEIERSAIQVGADRGADGTFAAGDSRMGRIGSLSAARLDMSVVAAGGNIDRITAGSMADSSVSSGLVLNGGHLDAVKGGQSLATAMARDLLRTDATLYRGDIGSASLGALTFSAVTAGIKPSNEGKFDGNAGGLTTSLTGGRSTIRSLSATLDNNSRVMADAGVGGSVVGGTVVGDVTYAIDDLLGGNALSTWRGVAGQGETLSYTTANGSVVTFTLTGSGFVDVYDENGDNVIDDLVLRGTNSTSRLAIQTSAPGNVSIGRVLSSDDCTLASFSFDGELVGDGTSAVDLWLDGPVNDFSVKSMGSGWGGQIGGDVALMTIQSQGAGALEVGGRIRQLVINGSTTTSLLQNLGSASGTQITEMAINSAGSAWVYDSANGRIGLANLVAGTITDPKLLRDSLGAVIPAGMDFDAMGHLLAVAQLYDPAPIIQVGDQMALGGVTLRGLAVSPAGLIVAVDSSSGEDRLVQINPSTGGFTNLGLVREITSQSTFSGQVRQLAFDASGNLYALLSDADGTGDGHTSGEGYALARLRQNPNYSGVWWAGSPAPNGADSAPVIISGGITESFTGLALSPSGQVWAVRRSGDVDVLCRLVVGAGTVTRQNENEISLGGDATEIKGIGFDHNGSLVGVSGGSMVSINTTTGLASILGAADTVDGDLTAFAIGRSGDTYNTYAYDTAGHGRFFKNAGVVAVLGSINTTNGIFTRIRSLFQDSGATPTPLTAGIASMAVDAGGSGNVVLVTDSGELYRYSAQGVLLGSGPVGQVLDGRTGQVLSITQLDFNDSNELVGLDATFKRLVTINTATAQATGRLPSGSIPTAATLAGMAFDSNSNGFFGVAGQTFVRFLAENRTQYDQLVGGITANGVDTLTVNAPEGFSGHITTNGNSFGSVNISGTFTGILTTAGSMGTVTQRTGDFGGTLVADRGISSLKIVNGSFLANALVETDGSLGSFSQAGVLTGAEKDEFQGVIDARSITQLSSAVDAVASALVRASGLASAITFSRSFDGHIIAGSVDRGLAVGGLMGGRIDIAGGASTMTLSGGTGSGSAITLGGDLQSLRCNGTFNGSLVVGRTLESAQFNQITDGMIIVGFGGSALSASGNVVNSLISYGTGVGADGVYNTADDVIYGGTLRSATFRGDFTSSALAAGVLPSLSSGPGMPLSMSAYTGDLTGTSTDADTAEAGGFFASGIGSASFARDVTRSAIAAADSLGTITGPNVRFMSRRVYGDPIGAPTIAGLDGVWNANDVLTQIRITFTEPVNSGSLSLSIDADNDGSVLGPADTLGSVLVRDEGVVRSDCTLSYETDALGRGVLVISREAGFSNSVAFRLSGATQPWIYDRSGMRSGLRDFNQDGVAEVGEDPFGTLLDGNDDGAEGDDYAW